MNETILAALLLSPPVCYVLAWIGSTAYFRAKMAYQRQLFREINKGD